MRKVWTEDEINLLEQMYKNNLSFDEISKKLNRSISSISTKSYELKLGDKYMRTNNPKFKAIYQDYNWCFEHYITQGMSYDDMALEANCSKRVIQKWCAEKHGIHQESFKHLKKLNDLQKELITAGTLGDGHIDRRIDQPMYIEQHAEDEKEYLYWKYTILKDICNKEPVYYGGEYHSFSGDKMYYCKPHYRICSRIVNELGKIRDTPRINKINCLTEFQFCLLILDDGSRDCNWDLCVAEWTDDEINCLINKCNEFGIRSHKTKDKRYISFDLISSDKIDKMILNNIPNELDVIKKKILNNTNISHSSNKYYFIIKDGERMSYTRYCKQNNINHENNRDIIILNSNEFNEINEDDFLSKINN